jgi:hypothetical protein
MTYEGRFSTWGGDVEARVQAFEVVRLTTAPSFLIPPVRERVVVAWAVGDTRPTCWPKDRRLRLTDPALMAVNEAVCAVIWPLFAERGWSLISTPSTPAARYLTYHECGCRRPAHSSRPRAAEIVSEDPQRDWQEARLLVATAAAIASGMPPERAATFAALLMS